MEHLHETEDLSQKKILQPLSPSYAPFRVLFPCQKTLKMLKQKACRQVTKIITITERENTMTMRVVMVQGKSLLARKSESSKRGSRSFSHKSPFQEHHP